MITEEWLNKVNTEFSEQNIPHIQRPLKAIGRYAVETGIYISHGSPEARAIYDWFKENTKEDAHNIGFIYGSTYFYDGEFWNLDMPVFYGTVEFNPYDALSNMPSQIKRRLISHKDKSFEYAKHWADCFDFGLGVNSLNSNNSLSSSGKGFLNAGFEELSSAASLLRNTRANPRAVMDSRMAIEMFFKAYADLKNELSDKEARQIGHDLEKGLNKMIAVSGYQYLDALKQKLSIYPDISDRYRGQSMEKPQLWSAFQLAQMVGALVTREFSDYNVLEQVEAANK